VLFVSGYADVIAAEGELEAGIDFLQKPYTSEALMYRVRAMLDRERGR
jgi:FixJ family two-component response regulator